MKNFLTLVLLSSLVMFGAACSTSSQIRIPADTKLTVYGRSVTPDAQGTVKTSPFFWSAAGGVPYALTDGSGKVVRSGKLKSSFRVVSIFWPPFALIYWPMGLGMPQYDLTKQADGYSVRDNAPMAAAAPAPEAPTPVKKKTK